LQARSDGQYLHLISRSQKSKQHSINGVIMNTFAHPKVVPHVT